MRALLQRVSSASVEIEGRSVAAIGNGLLVFLGVAKGDSVEAADWIVRKLLALRIFPARKESEHSAVARSKPPTTMNLSVSDLRADLLVVSQFTLTADTSRGNRPGFSTAEEPARAERLYQYVVDQLGQLHTGKVASGVFGADMQVALINDGPVTFLLEKR